MAQLGKVVFIDSVHPILWDRLIEMGWECFDKTHLEASEAMQEVKLYNGVVIRSKFKFTSDIFKSCPHLKFIARAGSGLENIDLEAADRHDVKIISSPEGNRDAVAEHATGMLLMLMNHLKRADKEVRNGIWKRAENRGYELKGKTIALIGYGVMGKALAKRLHGFDVNSIAFDNQLQNYSDQYTKEATLEEIYSQADIVSLHMNYNINNKYYINAEFIQKMEKPFYLINTARGFNVNTNALVEGLKSKKVLGACLDVLEFEDSSFETILNENTPEAFSYLINAENVLLSPHIAGWTHESHFKLSNVLANKIKLWLKD